VNPKTVIITGSNSGIGKAAAVKFAEAGHNVIMACRSIGRSQEVFNEVLNSSPGKTVELMQLDVSSFQSIQNFCSEFKRKYNVLDVLINNAAFFEHGKKEYQMSPDGIELTFATNTFGPFLLSELLKDVLAKSDDARILNACTENIMHFFDPKRRIELDNLHGEFKDTKKYSVYKNYGNSKMALLMLTFKMAEAYKSLGIKVNAIIIPGVKIAKETIKKMSPGYRLIAMIKQPFSLPLEKLADCYYHICTSDEFFNITGQAVNKHNHVMPAAKHDKEFC
jgi:NAD(P)-dependent dehydrogenase (short-subunit alcohol dehydrogenase family)